MSKDTTPRPLGELLTNAESFHNQPTRDGLAEKVDHGRQQALAQMASVSAFVAALELDYDKIDELEDDLNALNIEKSDADDALAHALLVKADAQNELTAANEELNAAIVACHAARINEAQHIVDCAAEELADANDAIKTAMGDRSDSRRALALWHENNGEELAELKATAGDFDSSDAARDGILADVAEVTVRSGWVTLDTDLSPSEFCLLLCSGGPHVEIQGELNEHGEPCRAMLFYSDWGTGLTDLCVSGSDASDLLKYAQQFNFSS